MRSQEELERSVTWLENVHVYGLAFGVPALLLWLAYRRPRKAR